MGVRNYHVCGDCRAIIADGADGIRAHGDGRCDAAEVRGVDYIMAHDPPKDRDARMELNKRLREAIARIALRP